MPQECTGLAAPRVKMENKVFTGNRCSWRSLCECDSREVRNSILWLFQGFRGKDPVRERSEWDSKYNKTRPA